MEEAFDLDSCQPLSFDEFKSRAAHRSQFVGRREHFLPSRTNYLNECVGFKVDRLYDWRALEALAHTVNTKHRDFYRKYWDLLKEVGRDASAAGYTEVLIEHKRDALYFHSYDTKYNTLGTRAIANVVKLCTSNPDEKFLYLSGSLLDRHHFLNERRNTWQKRVWVFNQAFHTAVEERLNTFILKNLRRMSDQCDVSAIFVIKANGRSYTVTSNDYGRLTWTHTNVYVQTEAK